MMQKNIIIDSRMINSSGIGRYLQNILPEIINYFSNVSLLGNPSEIKKMLRADNLNIIPFDKPIYSVSEQLQFPKIIPQCNIFFSPHYNIPLLPIKAKYRVVTIHDVFHLAFYKHLSLPQKIYSKVVINQALKKSDKIITVSEFSKSEILRYTDRKHADKISVIYNGVERMGEAITHRQLYNNLYFLFVGNVKPHKNLRKTLEAFRLLLSEYEQQKKEKPFFVIVGKKDGFITGDSGLVSMIENDLLLKNHVQFTGWVTDQQLSDLYSNAVSLVFPSYYEGFGFPPLEAMALNCPAIVSHAACMPEVCGDAVLYFNPFDANDIHAKMRSIIESEEVRTTLIKRGEEHMKKYLWEHAVQEHIRLFENLLKK